MTNNEIINHITRTDSMAVIAFNAMGRRMVSLLPNEDGQPFLTEEQDQELQQLKAAFKELELTCIIDPFGDVHWLKD